MQGKTTSCTSTKQALHACFDLLTVFVYSCICLFVYLSMCVYMYVYLRMWKFDNMFICLFVYMHLCRFVPSGAFDRDGYAQMMSAPIAEQTNDSTIQCLIWVIPDSYALDFAISRTWVRCRIFTSGWATLMPSIVHPCGRCALRPGPRPARACSSAKAVPRRLVTQPFSRAALGFHPP